MRNLVIIPTYNELDNIRPMIDKNTKAFRDEELCP